jgi:LPS export ABC transporter protein LptC
MGTYRLIRLMRVVLPVVVLVLIAIPARNYLTSRDRVAAKSPAVPGSAPDVIVHTLGETFTHRENGRDVFKVKAEELISFKNKKHELRGVHVVIFGEKPVIPGDKNGDFDQTVKADSGIYDQDGGDIHFFGNVRAQLDEKTWISTEELVYVHQERMISSPVRTHVEQPGEMTGDADRLSYSKGTQLLSMTGNAGMKMSNGESLHADAAEFQKLENWTSLSGNVFLEATNGWLRGTNGHADLEPGTYRPTLVTIEGDVTSESRVGRDAESPDSAAKSDRRAGTLKTHSNKIVSVISPQGVIQSVAARGDVRAEQMSKDEFQTMTGDEIDATLSSGHLDTMDARRANKPYAEMKQAGRSIVSDVIRIKSNGTVPNEDGTLTENVTVRTGGNSVLNTADTTITGKDFKIDQTGKLIFETPARATIDSGKRRTSADNTLATINNKTNSLESLTQIGHFQFKEGQRSGSADSAVITQNGDRVELKGAFSFEELTRSGKANHALITDNGNTIEMWDSVSFKDGSRRGTAAHARFSDGGETVNLDTPAPGLSKVVDDEKKSEIQARKISFNQTTNHVEAKDNVISVSRAQSEVVTVTAAQAVSNSDLVSYFGGVDLSRGATRIRADKIIPEKDNGFIAEGHVDSHIEGMHATADKLVYDDVNKTATYTGKVDAKNDGKSGEMKLKSDEMKVILESADSGKTGDRTSESNGVKEIRANGRVDLTQGARKGSADHLIYDYKTEKVTMWSDSPATVILDGPEEGHMIGIRVEWTANGKVRMQFGPGGKVPSTITVK